MKTVINESGSVWLERCCAEIKHANLRTSLLKTILHWLGFGGEEGLNQYVEVIPTVWVNKVPPGDQPITPVDFGVATRILVELAFESVRDCKLTSDQACLPKIWHSKIEMAYVAQLLTSGPTPNFTALVGGSMLGFLDSLVSCDLGQDRFVDLHQAWLLKIWKSLAVDWHQIKPFSGEAATKLSSVVAKIVECQSLRPFVANTFTTFNEVVVRDGSLAEQVRAEFIHKSWNRASVCQKSLALSTLYKSFGEETAESKVG